MRKTLSILSILFVANSYAQKNNEALENSLQINELASLNSIAANSDSQFQNSDSYAKTLQQLDPAENQFSYESNIQKNTSPYEWKWLRDGIWTGAGLGASAFGLYLIKEKEDLPLGEQSEFLDATKLQKKIDDINFLDQWVAGKHSEDANSISDIPFAISFAAPFALLFDDAINDHTGQYVGLYIESLATTAALYTITAGLVDRSRPYVYDNSGDTSNERRFKNNGQRSFYSGHVAATATATFFAAKVYSDYHPDADGKIFMWSGAAVLPAAVGIFRMEAGQHFLTDVLLGYALGAATGILVPELHKRKMENIDFYPSSGTNFNGENYTGMAFKYTF